ncbi:flavodoxin family protein [Vallitalea okinawensis]|uniref:flavodoxin family protein n=1 Tax=Vallitalea okinawensis TaxID=2078660 RepID=UPI000CFDB969|nr:NAD(P)H-dependent oxidoreductase [Vallitalea okinawensis]
MKLIAILGCSKNGNTTQIVQLFEKKLKEQIECEVEYLYLSDFDIGFCTGCHKCIFDDEKKCPHHVEVRKLEDKIMHSDGLILASPGYMFSVTGVMKNFLDHVAYNCHRPKYFYKNAFIIANCTRWQEKSVLTPMEVWLSGAGFTVNGKMYVDMLPFPLKEKILHKKRRLIEKKAHKFSSILKKDVDLQPRLGELMVFHAFKTLSKIAPNILKADVRYYESINAYEKSVKWYIPAKISLLKHYMANMMAHKMEKEISKMIDQDELHNVQDRYITRL